jgi:hypothetical protein
MPRCGVDNWSSPRSTQAVVAAWIGNRLARIVGAMLQIASGSDSPTAVSSLHNAKRERARWRLLPRSAHRLHPAAE